jgi:hypothetical protein
MAAKTRHPVPSITQIRDATEKKFGHVPCLWQAKIVQSILRGDKDVILIAATGSGKTLTFYMPLLFREDAIQIICTPLNVLGTLNVQYLTRFGFSAINVTAENATTDTFRVRVFLISDCRDQ